MLPVLSVRRCLVRLPFEERARPPSDMALPRRLLEEPILRWMGGLAFEEVGLTPPELLRRCPSSLSRKLVDFFSSPEKLLDVFSSPALLVRTKTGVALLGLVVVVAWVWLIEPYPLLLLMLLVSLLPSVLLLLFRKMSCKGGIPDWTGAATLLALMVLELMAACCSAEED